MPGSYQHGGLFGTGDYAYADGQLACWDAARQLWTPSALRQALVAGGAAGDIAVAGITPACVLVAVTAVENAGVSAPIGTMTDLTGEFLITADDLINNTGGTNTTGDKLHVWWFSR